MLTVLTFNSRYLLFAILLLLTEIFIAVFVNDQFIRPYFGDFLVVILLYCSIRTFFHAPVIYTAVTVLVFAFIVELTQYFHLIDYLGLQRSKVVRAFIGGSFDWKDIIAYVCGIACLLFMERKIL